MPPIDAFFAPLLAVLATMAVVLGVLAKVIAVRLWMDLGHAANDPVFRRAHRAAVYRCRPSLTLVR